MTREQLLLLRRRAANASAGPWTLDVEITGRDVRVVGPRHLGAGSVAAGGRGDDTAAIFDAMFVRDAREGVPALLEHVEQLEEQLASSREQLRRATREVRRLRQALDVIASPVEVSAAAHREACRLADRTLAGGTDRPSAER